MALERVSEVIAAACSDCEASGSALGLQLLRRAKDLGEDEAAAAATWL